MTKFKSFLKEWVLPILIGIVVVLLFKTYAYNVVKIDGPSMLPNLSNKEYVFVQRFGTIKRGDVIVFDATHEDPRIKKGNKDYVKRVIGVPGDTVSHEGDNIYVNGKKINQDYIGLDQRSAGTWGDWDLKTLSSQTGWQKKDQNTVKVPKNCYFVLGDNRFVSNDSRYFGYVDKDHIMGKVIVPFWNSDSDAKKNVNDLQNEYWAN